VGSNEYADALIAELARAGITEHTIEQGGKHPRLIYHQDGKRRMYVFPASPSDRRGLINAVTDIRRHLGIAAPKRAKSARPAKTRIIRDDAPMPTSFSVRPDPLAMLSAWKPPSRFRWVRTGGRTWNIEVIA